MRGIRISRRLVIGAGVVVALVAAVSAATLVGTGDDVSTAAAQDDADASLTVAEVQQTSLAETATLEGQLTFADPLTLSADMAGAVVALPEPGTIVVQGEALYSVATGATALDVLNAASQLAAANSQLATADSQLESTITGASAGDLAAAQASVVAAQRALNELTDPPTAAEVASAEANLAGAEQRLDDLQAAPTAAERASAEAQLAQAESGLVNAKGSAATARTSLTTAFNEYCALASPPVSLCGSVLPLTDAQVGELEDAIVAADADGDPDDVVGSTQALVSAARADATAVGAVTSAEASVDSAIASLDRLDDPPTGLATAAAQADVDATRKALDELLAGPTAQRVQEAEADLATARTRLADLEEGATPEARAAAQAASQSAAASLTLSQAQYDDLISGAASPILLYGHVPATRTLSADATGTDVGQLQANLIDLGFDADGDLAVTGVFDGPTERAVAAWQTATGQELDGSVESDEIVFLAGPVQVESWSDGVQLGGAVTSGAVLAFVTPVAELSSSEGPVAGADLQPAERVIADLPLADRALAEVGDEVTIRLPDLTELPGTIESIGSVPIEDPTTGDTWVEITVAPSDEVDSIWTGAAIDVLVVEELAADVLAVPVSALVALVEGGYAVEVVEGTGARLVGVTPGMFADGLVEVAGDLEAGDQVLVPR